MNDEDILNEILDMGEAAMQLTENLDVVRKKKKRNKFIPKHKSFKLDAVFYHGANSIYPNGLVPISPNLGNKWEPAKWTTYMFTKREYALRWAVYRALTKKMHELYEAGDPNVEELSNFRIRDSSTMIYIAENIYDELKRLAVGLKCYIYKFTVKPETIGVGHDGGLNEFTSTDPHPKILDIEEVRITPKLFDSVTIPVSIETTKKLKYDNQSRELFSGLMHNQQEVYKKEEYIFTKIHAGALKAQEDDIVKAVEQYDMLKQFGTENKDIYKLLNQIKPTSQDEDNVFIWPDELIKSKIGNCFDVAFFLHMIYDIDSISNRIGRVGVAYKKNSTDKTINHQLHVVCIKKDYKTKGKDRVCSIIQNDGPDRLSKHPFYGNDKYDETLELFSKAYLPGMIRWLKDQYPNMVIVEQICQILDKKKLGEFERKYCWKKGVFNKQRIIENLFK